MWVKPRRNADVGLTSRNKLFVKKKYVDLPVPDHFVNYKHNVYQVCFKMIAYDVVQPIRFSCRNEETSAFM